MSKALWLLFAEVTWVKLPTQYILPCCGVNSAQQLPVPSPAAVLMGL